MDFAFTARRTRSPVVDDGCAPGKKHALQERKRLIYHLPMIRQPLRWSIPRKFSAWCSYRVTRKRRLSCQWLLPFAIDQFETF